MSDRPVAVFDPERGCMVDVYRDDPRHPDHEPPVEHLFTFGTYGRSYIEFGCCQLCGAVVVIDGHEEIKGKGGFGGQPTLNITRTAADHVAWHIATRGSGNP